jgi:hypothetical protein
MKSINILSLSVLLSVLSLGVGCVKQHPLDDSQSNRARIANGELVAIQSLKSTYVVPTNTFQDVSPSSTERPELEYHFLDNSSFKAQTNSNVEPSGMSVVRDVRVSDGASNIRFADKVGFETDAPLLKNHVDKVDFLGSPNKSYEIKYKLTPTALMIMKIVTKEEITHHELPYSDYLGNDTYAVPLGGYAIQTLKRRRVLNQDNDVTNRYEYVEGKLRFNEDGSLKTNCSTCADFISLNSEDEGFQKFAAILDKRDVYPADYFTGKWYFSEGVVNTKPGSETAIGFISGSFDADFRNASKIKFFRTAGTIKGYNIAVDEELSDDEAINLSPVISIPAAGKSYKLNDSGMFAQMSEVEVPNISVEQAPYLKMNFEGLTTVQTIFESKFSILGTIGTTSAGLLKEVMFNKDSFSLTFEDVTNGRRLRYSFLRAEEDRDYTARRHYKEDREIFGYFPTVRTRFRRAAEDYREEDFEKNILIQRLNPKKDVVFYFSDLTPKDNNGKCRPNADDNLGNLLDSKGDINYREIGRRAVKYWDQAFAAAGAPNGVVLNEVDSKGVCFDAPLGDLQYNSINMLDTIQATNLLGVGPSLVDPYSGEVINTTMNVHISPFRSIVSAEIREFMSSRLGLFKDRSNRLSKAVTTVSTILNDSTETYEGLQNKLISLIPSKMRRYVADLYHFGAYDKDRDLSDLNFYNAVNSNEFFDFYAAFDKFNPDSKEVQHVQLVSDRILETDVLVRGDKINSGKIRTLSEYKRRLQLIEKYRPDYFRARMTMESLSALASLNSMDADIKEKCPEVQAFVDLKLNQAKAAGTSPVIVSSEENPIVKSCMNKLIPDKILATVVHEMGHNLGLRHNFYGSADPKNFFNKEEIRDLYGISIDSDLKLPKSSTSMEYIPSDKDRLYYPGHYDIAAIRYGYANQIEVDSNDRPNLQKNIKDLSENTNETNSGPEGSIVANQNRIGKIRNYKYCTDHQASLDFDPLCQRHDFGTTPTEVVDGLINDYFENLVVYGARFDRRDLINDRGAKLSASNQARRLGILYNLKRFYDEWRYKLADHLGVGNEYVDKYDRKSYETLLASLKTDASFNGKEYLAVRDKIFKFLNDVAFLNNKYCVTLDLQTQQPIMLELEKIRIQVRSQAPDAIIANCEDSGGLVKSYIEKQGLEYIGDIGFSLNDYKFKLDSKEAFEDEIDITGAFLDRLYATIFLTERSQRVPGLLQKIQPSMLDEVDFYETYESKVLDRILLGANLGLDISNLIKNNPNKDPDASDIIKQFFSLNIPEDSEIMLSKFEAEGSLVTLMWNLLENGVNNPFVDSTQRSTKYGRFVDNLSQSDIQDLRAEGGIAIPIASGRYLIIRRENEISMLLAQAFSQLSQKAGNGFFFQDLVVPEEESQKLDLINRTQPKFTDAISDLPDTVQALKAEDYIQFAQDFDKIFDYEKVDFFEVQLATMLTAADFAAYDYFLRGIVEEINARVAAGVDASDLQAELNNLITQINADVPAFFKAAEAAIQKEINQPNFKVSIPTKSGLQQRFLAQSKAATDALVSNVLLTQRDYKLNQEEYMAHFRLVQSILLGQGGAELGAQLAQSALTRLDVAQGRLETPVQRFMERYFPDQYVKYYQLDRQYRQHLNEINYFKNNFMNSVPQKFKADGFEFNIQKNNFVTL